MNSYYNSWVLREPWEKAYGVGGERSTSPKRRAGESQPQGQEATQGKRVSHAQAQKRVLCG